MSAAEWRLTAKSFVRDFAPLNGEFTGNDLWAAGLRPTENRRNLSGVLLALEKEGRLVRTGQRKPSAGGHGQPILVWRAA